ncbi:MAG TPA: hypothetical protein DC054_05880, partial [Blastocatellia bacterium]|nr:hypothetical protein [Blastocatellia bacterium]
MKDKSRQPSYDVFLSHSAKDREFVAHLATDLAAAGLRVWLDQWNIKIGDSFAAAIDEAMRASRFLLIVMSPDYFQSAWTRQEWQYALAEEIEGGGIRVIPILYRDCEIPPMLRSKQWVDFRDETQYRPVIDRLVRELHSLGSSETTPRKVTEAPKPGERVEELDATTLSDLKKVLQDAVEAFRAKPDTPPALTTTADLADMDEEMCFIVMPFSVESLNIVYEDFVKPTLVDRCLLRAERGDDVFGSNVIMDDITKSIRRARLIIGDLTGRNPNVFYEVGIAHALNKQVLLMTQSIDDVPFDLRHR